MPQKYRMTALKCILCGDIKKHIELREDELKTYEQMREIVMKWAVPKRIEKERGHTAPMDVDQADKEDSPKEDNGGDEAGYYGWGGGWNGEADVDWTGKGGKGSYGKGYLGNFFGGGNGN